MGLCHGVRAHDLETILGPAACRWERRSQEYNNRHRGSDEGDAPLLVELEGAAADGDGVLRTEKSNQAEGEATDGLGQAQAIEVRPGAGSGWWC